MYTQCPECLSVFSLGAQALAQAHAFTICGHCGAGFDSLATLADTLPDAPFRELPLNTPALTPPQVDLVVYRPQVEPPVVIETTPPADATAADEFAKLVFAPRFARTRPQKRAKRDKHDRHRHFIGARERRWPWALACAALTLALVAQVAWATRASLITHAPTSGWLRAGCAALHCALPLIPAPRQIHLLDSNVQTHPSVPGALMISASVRNDARFAQPYPVLVLTLSNAQGERVAMRRLRPRDYLDDTAVRQRGLAPGASTVLVLEVADPGEQAVAFEFGFE
ncbi:MAG: zinc-ribbon and DUF3426 domain-containing protein [Rhodanobacter sp.]